MNKTTNDKAIMKQMGINPGMVSRYSDVSLEPVSYTKESNLEGFTRWCANHSAVSNFSGNAIEVDGLSFSVDDNKSQSVSGLNNAWMKRMEQIKEVEYQAEQYERQENAYAE